MTCGDLEEYVDRALSPTRTAAFLAHLEGCPRCALEIERQERLDRSLSAVSKALAPAPSSLVRRIEREIAALEARRRAVMRWSAAAAVLLAGVGIGLGSLLDGNAGRDREQEAAREGARTSAPPVARIVPSARPTASVVLAEGSRALAVPVETENVDATIVFVFPILDTRETVE